MLYADGVLGIALLCLWVYSLLDVLTSDQEAVRNLPKWGWFLVVLVLGELGIGPLLWFVAGRPRGAGSPASKGRSFPGYPRPAPAPAQHPDDDEAFLRGLRERAEEQRRRAADEHGAGPEDDSRS